MNKRLLIYFVIFLGTIFSIQGMETSNTVMFSYLSEALQPFSKRDQPTSGPFNNITSSYFLHNQKYIKRVEEFIFKDWKLENSSSSLINLIDDVSNNNKIRKVKKYTIDDYRPLSLLYYRSQNYGVMGTLENICIDRICQYAAIDEKLLKKASSELSNDLLKKLSQYPRFLGAPKLIDDSTENNITQQVILQEAKPSICDNVPKVGNIKKKGEETYKDYKKEACDLLEAAYLFIKRPMNLAEIELQSKIDLYLKEDAPYNKKEIGQLFNDILSLYGPRYFCFDESREKIKEMWERKIFLYLLKVSSDGKLKPQDLLQKAVIYLAYLTHGENRHDDCLKDCGFSCYGQLYNWVIGICFEKYPWYAANTLVYLAITANNLELKKEALGIVALYELLQKVVDCNKSIIQNVLKDASLLRIFLSHGAKFSPSIVHEAIKADNDKALILLEAYSHTDFCDPTFVNTALKSKSFACLSFLFDKQKNMLSQDDKDHIWKMVCDRCENIENVYDQKYYKALWRAKLTGDICKLEKFIIKNFTCDDAKLDDQKREEIIEELKQSAAYYWSNENDKLKALKNINHVANTLSSASLRLLQKDKNFLPSLLSVVQEKKVKMDNHYQFKDIKSDIEFFVANKKFILFCLNAVAFLTACAINNRDSMEFVLLALLVSGVLGGVAVLQVLLCYPMFLRIKSGVSLCKQVNYLEGFLQGLLGKIGHNNLELQKKSLDLDISRTEVLKILSTFTLVSMSEIHNRILDIAFCSILKSAWDFYINNENNARSKKLDELLAGCLEEGKADGFARMSALKKKKRKFNLFRDFQYFRINKIYEKLIMRHEL